MLSANLFLNLQCCPRTLGYTHRISDHSVLGYAIATLLVLIRTESTFVGVKAFAGYSLLRAKGL
eukprot:792567-Prorocentrum_minimum.AAC.2